MSINIVAASLRACSLVCALGVLAACETDPTPIVEDSQSLSLAPTGRSGGSGGLSSVSGDYRLGPNDRTRITVFGQPNLTGEFMLDGNGAVAFPLIGNINANGMTPRELQQAIAGKLDPDYLRNPSVSVEVLTRRPFYVLGEVQKPGNYPYVTDITALNAVAMAGGYTYRAKTTEFYVKRLDKDGRMVRVVAKPETIIRPGDTLEVRERYF
ncbi:MAG: polysaccharide export protein [Proteobacteria bacterium]|uniref:polysaccharide biosynthesis/export family protein n=1 Tax=Reyranella massiliensis TaxID=445220 RepID=UPI00030AC392|nr:polysaccharide biosynthesis/export family protein [Reyranella massiliensis]MCA0248021.1 polysaccharide export protein [Pseudomonadota bacterium]